MNDQSKIGRLKLFSELKGKEFEIFTESDIIKLCIDHKIPHYILENPISNEKSYLFDQKELRQYIENAFLTQYDCFKPITLISSNHSDFSVDISDDVPIELRLVKNLLKYPREVIITQPGIYFLCNRGKIVYVGQAKRIAPRISDHIRENQKEFDQVFFIIVPEKYLNEVETSLIRHYNPKYNGGENRDYSHLKPNENIINNILNTNESTN